MRIARLVTLALVAGLLGCDSRSSGPTSPEADLGHVTGTITYRERVALPPEAVVEVRLSDVSLQNAPSFLIGKSIMSETGQVPIAFEVSYHPSVIDPQHTYAVGVRITVGNELWFINTTSYPVITRGNPSHVDMVVELVRR